MTPRSPEGSSGQIPNVDAVSHMVFEPSQIETLLYEDESATLDFKRDQYIFEGGTADQKSEMLKDILAFANSWRRADAFIIIGVDDVVGGRGKVVGVQQHLDEANLQQFVNSKTNRPVHFSYETCKIENKQIGVIRIPIQPRPLYVRKGYGKLVAKTVYIRRGSSTDDATPDEIAEMGREQAAAPEALPLLELEFGDPSERGRLGTALKVRTERVVIPDVRDIPSYGTARTPSYMPLTSVETNTDFYKDVAAYLRDSLYLADVCFSLTNQGVTLATDVHVEMTVNDVDGSVLVMDEYNCPRQPKVRRLLHYVPEMPINADSTAERVGNDWLIRVDVSKIQPKQTVWSNNSVYVGVESSRTLLIKATVYADEMPGPETFELRLEIEVGERILSARDIISMVKAND